MDEAVLGFRPPDNEDWDRARLVVYIVCLMFLLTIVKLILY